MIQIVAKAKKQSETFNLPVAQCHESKEYEDSANPGDQADDHDNGIAVRFFDCFVTSNVDQEDTQIHLFFRAEARLKRVSV